jgi:hypothetical protein
MRAGNEDPTYAMPSSGTIVGCFDSLSHTLSSRWIAYIDHSLSKALFELAHSGYLLIFLHRSPRINLKHLHCNLVGIRCMIDELGQVGQTNLFYAFTGADGALINHAE